MKCKSLFLFLVFILIAMQNYGENKEEISEITNISYNKQIYMEYINNTPIFYKKGDFVLYIIKPIYVKYNGINSSLIQRISLKENLSNYKILFSKKYINIPKDRIGVFFTKTGNSKKINTTIKTIYWKKDPLRYGTSKVLATYELPNKGEIIATYENGAPAIIRLNNTIYCGFEPTATTIYNLAYLYIIKKQDFGNYYLLGLLVLFGIILSYLTHIQQYLKNLLLKYGAGLIVLGRVSINDEEKVLLNNTRNEIYNTIIDNPGIHLRELAEKVGKSTSTITWHIRILEKANLIQIKKLGGKIMYFPKSMDLSDIPLLYLENDLSKKIYEKLLETPLHLRKLAQELGAPVETVRYNLKKLEALGVIKSKKENNKIVYYINPSALS